MTRSVLFDTETTGLDPQTGDRVIEIAALELVNDLPTGRQFHRLIHPERDIPPEATRVHGLTLAHLEGKPRFREIAEELLAFMGAEDMLVAHNAPFDFGFLNWELKACGLPPLGAHRMVDTLVLAKQRFPGMPNSLDALCRRFGIDLSERTSHNALLDCRLLAEVYVELTGGRQRGLSLALGEGEGSHLARYEAARDRAARPILVSAEEAARHAAFLGQVKEALWLRQEAEKAEAEAGAAPPQLAAAG
ncbi:DNA polymerase III subunit epsilon [Acidisoma sp. C75]